MMLLVYGTTDPLVVSEQLISKHKSLKECKILMILFQGLSFLEAQDKCQCSPE